MIVMIFTSSLYLQISISLKFYADLQKHGADEVNYLIIYSLVLLRSFP